jgi:hypothetical protein
MVSEIGAPLILHEGAKAQGGDGKPPDPYFPRRGVSLQSGKEKTGSRQICQLRVLVSSCEIFSQSIRVMKRLNGSSS